MNWEDIYVAARRMAVRAVCRLTEEEGKEQEERDGLLRELTETRLFEKEMRRRSRYDAGKAFRLARGKKHRMPVRQIVAVACCLAVAVGCLWLLAPEDAGEGEMPTFVHGIHGNREICLELGDGKRVALGEQDTLQLREQDKIIDVRGGEIVYAEGTGDVRKEAMNTLTVPKGAEFRIRLSDGTVVHLNADSRLQYPAAFSGKERRVRLQGEGWFEVAKNPEVPFYVMADELEIRVYGTSFNVNTHGMKTVETVLVEGSVGVRLLLAAGEVRMQPGQLAEYGRTGKEIKVREVNTRQYTAWKEGYFYFDDKTLEEIMNELSRWYDMEIEYRSERGRMLHFSGYVPRYKDVRRILATLTESVGIRFDVTENRITVD